ncbi:MAG: hypothetical protein R8P61_00155 [Bacteroidia bacterium]|nr:hypothetical protein [Bacteroidia bacterium]
MANLSHDLLLELKSCLEATHSLPAEFIALIGQMDNAQLQIGWGDVSTDMAVFNDIRFNFIKQLNVRGSIFYFIEQYCQAFQGNVQVSSFHQKLEELVSRDTAGLLRYNKELFDFADAKNLPFIGRKETKKYFYLMFHGDPLVPKLLLVNGKSRTGTSYLKNYFSELADSTKLFRFVGIDLRFDLENKTDELVQSVHIAKHLAINLDMEDRYKNLDTSLGKDFKYQSFLTNLKVHLEKSEQAQLFFLDHFKDTVADETYDFLTGLASLLTLQNAPGYLIFAGYTERGLDLLDDSDIPYAENIMESFSKEHIEKFFEKIHVFLSAKFADVLPDELKASEQFIDKGMEIFKDQDFNENPNVEPIGKKAKRWYKKLKRQLVMAGDF